MMLERADLRHLRIPIVGALLLAGIGVAALVLAQTRLVQAEQLNKSVHEQLTTARGRLAAVSEEEQAIRNDLAQFRKFQDIGMTGGEKRLEWIEAIAAIREKRGLFQVQYTLEPRRDADYPGLTQNRTASGALFMASGLRLELALLHEGDLLGFLADLRASSGSFSTLRSCSVSRTAPVFSGRGPMRARLRASCFLDMITLREPGKT